MHVPGLAWALILRSPASHVHVVAGGREPTLSDKAQRWWMRGATPTSGVAMVQRGGAHAGARWGRVLPLVVE